MLTQHAISVSQSSLNQTSNAASLTTLQFVNVTPATPYNARVLCPGAIAMSSHERIFPASHGIDFYCLFLAATTFLCVLLNYSVPWRAGHDDPCFELYYSIRALTVSIPAVCTRSNSANRSGIVCQVRRCQTRGPVYQRCNSRADLQSTPAFGDRSAYVLCALDSQAAAVLRCLRWNRSRAVPIFCPW
ncbi:hypothetical protein BS50DRAFT_346001 [Corynespora cassiicola Philippines]|uniref:Uncharacterized protein n=1 Tax=Corynespora cassiicola Philippines TaxID=1448308 RepID=A0A2T2NQQ4_CORCC|nr:hypothetical protein BS50DRAFT_346001 [Corynespora cassiicola Philippines]